MRHQLRSLVAVTFIILAIAGCKEKKPAPPPEPHKITAETECALDGMIVRNYPGPKAQIVYKSNTVDFFCETKEVFQVYLEPGKKATVAAVYVQDAGHIDWERPLDGWIDAKKAIYVVGSRKQGSMGPTYAPFSERGQAERFKSENGGRIMTFDELLKELER